MDSESWEASRLIPVSGINGSDEQERRGSSALLAVLSSVKEFGRATVRPLGAPAGTITTFIEVPFKLGERTVRPDGVIRVTRGSNSWTALVEVKTGRNDLQAAQVEAYIDVAREQGFDVVLTISNQLETSPGVHPTAVDRKKLRKVALHHLSWSQIHTEASIQRVNSSVADPDQAWILDELIRYLEHERSGAVDFDDMGQSWVTVRNAVSTRTLRSNDSGCADVVARFAQLVAFAGMRLSRRLGVEVRPALSRADINDSLGAQQRATLRLADAGVLEGVLRVPNTVAAIAITADLRSNLVTCSVDVPAPTEGRNRTRVNWLIRQLGGAPTATQLEAWSVRSRMAGPCQPISAIRENPDLLVEDPKKELKSFTIRLAGVAGTKRGQVRGSFVGSVLTLVDDFYDQVVVTLKPWVASAPTTKAKAEVEPDDVRDDIVGELPLQSVEHASATPEWAAPRSSVHTAFDGQGDANWRRDRHDEGDEVIDLVESQGQVGLGNTP